MIDTKCSKGAGTTAETSDSAKRGRQDSMAAAEDVIAGLSLGDQHYLLLLHPTMASCFTVGQLHGTTASLNRTIRIEGNVIGADEAHAALVRCKVTTSFLSGSQRKPRRSEGFQSLVEEARREVVLLAMSRTLITCNIIRSWSIALECCFQPQRLRTRPEIYFCVVIGQP